MSQDDDTVDLDASVGYALKQAATALRGAMDAALRPLDLTVSQYSCLEVLDHHPRLSNAELARATFVTRQAMNGVLRGLQDRGLVTRPDEAEHGRARPTELTDTGRRTLGAASVAVRSVERRMLSGLSPAGQRRLRADLHRCLTALSPDAAAQGPDAS